MEKTLKIDSLQTNVPHIRLPRYCKDNCFWDSSEDLRKYLFKIFDIIFFNIAIRFDPHWTDLDDIPSPISNLEDYEIDEYLSKSGNVITRSPLTWEFKDYKLLVEIVHGFFNADDSSILNINDLGKIKNSQLQPNLKDLMSISEYFMTTLADYTGFIIFSNNPETIKLIEAQLSNIENLTYRTYLT